MASRLWLACSLLALAACVAEPKPEPAVDVVGDAAPAALTSSTIDRGENAAPAEQVRIDVLRSPQAGAGRSVEQLGVFGYRTRPSTSAGALGVPDIQQQFPEAAVRVLDVNWGIDSSAVLVTIDADGETIGRAEEHLGETTSWLVSGDRWLAALYQGGLAASFEMKALAEVVSWVLAPDAACELSDQACPAGSDVGFPPPPPSLVLNATPSAPAPFEVIELSAGMIGTDALTVTWVEDGEVFTSWVNPGNQRDAESRGAATVAYSFGSFVFVVVPQPDAGSTVELRPCCEQAASSAWSVPQGWTIEGLAVTGNFGQGDYRLIIAASVGDGSSVVVAVPLDERFFDQESALRPEAIETLPNLTPRGRRWSRPQRSASGGLVIVEERQDGWYLIDDALNDGRELLRSSHPILDYSVASGDVHVALVVEGPAGPDNWWINGTDTSQLDGSATSLGWFGTHSPTPIQATE